MRPSPSQARRAIWPSGARTPPPQVPSASACALRTCKFRMAYTHKYRANQQSSMQLPSQARHAIWPLGAAWPLPQVPSASACACAHACSVNMHAGSHPVRVWQSAWLDAAATACITLTMQVWPRTHACTHTHGCTEC